jgi:hypothetical protein
MRKVLRNLQTRCAQNAKTAKAAERREPAQSAVPGIGLDQSAGMSVEGCRAFAGRHRAPPPVHSSRKNSIIARHNLNSKEWSWIQT